MEDWVMKKIQMVLVLACAFLSFRCEPLGESTVGSPADTQIYGASFTVDSTYVNGSSLYATGRVTNTGTAALSPPWYVEAQFYTDATYSTKLGGNYATINVPLNRGQTTFWKIGFTSNNVDVRSYPNFRVSDIRAIYK